MSYRPLKTPLHLGVRRSPIRTTEDALALTRRSEDLPGVRIDSIMGYEAHIAGLNDDLPDARVKSRILRTLKKASVRELTERRGSVVERLRREGLELRAVNGGGSGSLLSTGADPSVTEVTAGSAFTPPACSGTSRKSPSSLPPSSRCRSYADRRKASSLVTGEGMWRQGP